MRTVLTILLAFAAGVLLMLWVPGRVPLPWVADYPRRQRDCPGSRSYRRHGRHRQRR